MELKIISRVWSPLKGPLDKKSHWCPVTESFCSEEEEETSIILPSSTIEWKDFSTQSIPNSCTSQNLKKSSTSYCTCSKSSKSSKSCDHCKNSTKSTKSTKLSKQVKSLTVQNSCSKILTNSKPINNSKSLTKSNSKSKSLNNSKPLNNSKSNLSRSLKSSSNQSKSGLEKNQVRTPFFNKNQASSVTGFDESTPLPFGGSSPDTPVTHFEEIKPSHEYLMSFSPKLENNWIQVEYFSD